MKTGLIALVVGCAVVAAAYILTHPRASDEAVAEALEREHFTPVPAAKAIAPCVPGDPRIGTDGFACVGSVPLPAAAPAPLPPAEVAPVAPSFVFTCHGAKCASGVPTWVWGTYAANVTAYAGPRRECEDTLAAGGTCDLRAYEPDPDGCYCAPEEVRP